MSDETKLTIFGLIALVITLAALFFAVMPAAAADPVDDVFTAEVTKALPGVKVDASKASALGESICGAIAIGYDADALTNLVTDPADGKLTPAQGLAVVKLANRYYCPMLEVK